MTKDSESKSPLPDLPSNLPAKTRRLLSSVGPWILGQFEEASKKYTKHKLRQVGVDILKQVMSAEMATLAQARKKLLLSLASSTDPVKRVTITSNLRHVDEEVRRFSAYIAAFKYAQEGQKEDSAPEITHIDAVWLDRFDEFARRQNEEWRRGLLAKALNKETEQPGSIGLRALWLIGTLEEQLFDAFATILDLTSIMDDEPLIPFSFDPDAPIPGCPLSGSSIGNLSFLLHDTGLLGAREAGMTFADKDTFIAKYGDIAYVIDPQRKLVAKGILVSPLGKTVGSLYEPKFNQMGLEIFEKWIKRLGIFAKPQPKAVSLPSFTP